MATTQRFSEEPGLDSASSLIKGKLSAQWSFAEHPALRTHTSASFPCSSRSCSILQPCLHQTRNRCPLSPEDKPLLPLGLGDGVWEGRGKLFSLSPLHAQQSQGYAPWYNPTSPGTGRRLGGPGAETLYVKSGASGGDGNLSCSWWSDLTWYKLQTFLSYTFANFILQWFLHLRRKKRQPME